MVRVILLIIFLIIGLCCYSQISGHIFDENNKPLPYASIFIEGTNVGTVSNEQGEYVLWLNEKGKFTISCQFIGYQKSTKTIEIIDTNLIINLNFNLKIDSYLFEELTITSNVEDPAYGIIRKAIANKKENSFFTNSYKADMYIKGVIKIIDAPDKFLGQEIGNMGGILDSTKNGMLYLSESKSKIFYKFPDKWKEEMYASKISGQDIGLSLNTYTQAKFNFYDNYLEFDRSFVSPLNDNTFDYYDFEYQGTTIDQDGISIYKINIKPKSEYTPLFKGEIYISGNKWAISGVDLSLSGKSLKIEALDSLNINQYYRVIGEKYYLKDQTLKFKAHFFNFKLGGYFVYSFTDLDIDSPIDSKKFGNEIFLQKLNNELQSETYWDTIRPVPLLLEEKKDYIKKDSLAIIWKSKAYKDSIDRKNNKFGILNLFLGYTYRQSFTNKYFSFSAPISSLQFNAVEGFLLNTEFKYVNRDFTKNNFTQVTFKPQYGFADRKIKYGFKAIRVFDEKNNGVASFAFGRSLKHFDNRFTFLESWNSILSLLYKRNQIKLYQSTYYSAALNKEISNSITFYGNLTYEKRQNVKVNTQYSFFRKDREFESNEFPLNTDLNEVETAKGGLILSLNLSYKPGIKVYNFAKFKVKELSGWPKFIVNYERALPFLEGDIDFEKIQLGFDWNNINFNLKGYSHINVRFGKFLSRKFSGKVDRFHFDGTLSSLYDISNTNLRFMRMPVYIFSSNQDYLKFHWRHYFNGYIMDRIPLFKDIGIKSILSFSYITLKNEKDYFETSFGFENIGFGPFRLFNLEYVWQYSGNSLFDHGIVVGIKKRIF